MLLSNGKEVKIRVSLFMPWRCGSGGIAPLILNHSTGLSNSCVNSTI